MKIPKALLREPVSIDPYLRRAFDGPVYDTPVAAEAHVEPGRRVVMDAGGNEVVSEATMYFDAAVTIKTEDQVTWDGRVYQVIGARRHRMRGRTVYVEAMMR